MRYRHSTRKVLELFKSAAILLLIAIMNIPNSSFAQQNTLFIQQVGDLNRAVLEQVGSANEAVSMQGIDGAFDSSVFHPTFGNVMTDEAIDPSIVSHNNMSFIFQNGEWNNAYNFQFGSYNLSSIVQTGSDNFALQAHVGNRNTTAIHQDGGDVGSIVVVGNRNAYTLDMTGGSVGGPVAVTIYGDGAGTGGPSTISVTTSP